MFNIITDQGMRDHMEDHHDVFYNIYENLHYFAIFDGHGGDSVSTFLKVYFKDIIKKELVQNKGQNIEKCLMHSFVKMNEIIPRNIGITTGSTALIILKGHDKLYIANIGDCRAITNFKTKALPITIDHKPNLKREYERITNLGGLVLFDPYGTPRVNGNLAVSRSFGDFYLSPYVTWTPDIFTVDLNNNNNFLIAASDGLWDTLSNQEVIDIVIKNNINNKNLNLICMNLLNKARIKGSGDNITILFLSL